jgi:hypothetical protein
MNQNKIDEDDATEYAQQYLEDASQNACFATCIPAILAMMAERHLVVVDQPVGSDFIRVPQRMLEVPPSTPGDAVHITSEVEREALTLALRKCPNVRALLVARGKSLDAGSVLSATYSFIVVVMGKLNMDTLRVLARASMIYHAGGSPIGKAEESPSQSTTRSKKVVNPDPTPAILISVSSGGFSGAPVLLDAPRLFTGGPVVDVNIFRLALTYKKQMFPGSMEPRCQEITTEQFRLLFPGTRDTKNLPKIQINDSLCVLRGWKAGSIVAVRRPDTGTYTARIVE